jgi:hypothetical protein
MKLRSGPLHRPTACESKTDVKALHLPALGTITSRRLELTASGTLRSCRLHPTTVIEVFLHALVLDLWRAVVGLLSHGDIGYCDEEQDN